MGGTFMAEMKHYVIYNKPEDYPNNIVVRIWVVGRNSLIQGPIVSISDTIEQARETIPNGMCCISRSEYDPLSIIETWI